VPLVLVLVVGREASGSRLDRFLATQTSWSRSELQRWISDGRVAVDGVVRVASVKVSEGARVEVTPDEPARTEARAEEGIAFDILFVDEDLVVVNKPAGLVVHPARGHESGTLVNGLLARGLFDSLDPSDDDAHVRPGIVHRLDKGTSGVMVVARNGKSRERLKTQFQDHSIAREYVAIVVGEVVTQTFASLHGRHPKERLKFTSRVVGGKRAVTHVEVSERLGGATLLVCRLETGRTHQIRMHLAENGTPVLGDPLYGRPPRDVSIREIADELGHQALHARLLGFIHPRTGKRVSFAAPPPEQFTHALQRLRGA
jgi:23S rRNA pseudouridine1911/1915/1917 synthase